MLLQLDIFISLFQESFSYKGASVNTGSSSQSDHDDTLDLDVSDASFFKNESVLNAEETERETKDDPCSRAFDMFEELVGSVVMMGDVVYLEVPQVTMIYSLVEQVAPSCLPMAEARYGGSEGLLAAVSAKVIVSKHAAQYLCGVHNQMNHEEADEKCLHLEVKAMEAAHYQPAGSNSDSSQSNIYRFKLVYFSQFDFKLLQKVTMAQNVKEFNKQFANKAVKNGYKFDHNLPSVKLWSNL